MKNPPSIYNQVEKRSGNTILTRLILQHFGGSVKGIEKRVQCAYNDPGRSLSAFLPEYAEKT
jgi:hypothetical protein